MKHPMTKVMACTIFLLLLLFLFGIIWSQRSVTKTASTVAPDTDPLEHRLEIGLHEKLLSVKGNPDNALTPFTTDGCSGGLSVGWEYLANHVPHFQEKHGSTVPWEPCCVDHDRLYHSGGEQHIDVTASFEARHNADLELKNCVMLIGQKRSPELMKEYELSAAEVEQLYTTIANLMYGAVRVGGIPCSGLPWRWGYGWPHCR